jgi:hypothetical protein
MERSQQGPKPLIGREMLLLFRFGISLLRKVECTNIHQHSQRIGTPKPHGILPRYFRGHASAPLRLASHASLDL